MIKVRKRTKVLRYSLHLERVASAVIARLLDIEEIDESLSLGNRSSCLSFNQKLNLLIDNRTITKEEKQKLEAIGNIRNQFMHNINANTYSEAVMHTDGLDKRLKKCYPHNFEIDNLEDSFGKCIDELFYDGLKILVSHKGGSQRKIEIEAEATFYKGVYEKLDNSVNDVFNEAINDIMNDYEGNSIPKSNLIEALKFMKLDIISRSMGINIYSSE